MIRTTSIPVILVAALLTAPLPVLAGDDEHDLGLVSWMGRLQYYTHKLGLAVDAGNKPLVAYYIHEVEEVIEKIEDIDDADGVPIGKLVKEILVPTFESLEESSESGDEARVDRDYNRLLGACNQCHEKANRPYLIVERRHDNPYMQRFKPSRVAVEPVSE
ncbi:hypothetical protein [Thiocapsa roseopersicina]|uniref:Cytochrome C n=1 Tax=Thiocapsa roseopersicina TaxID=1058 RepID=A0A1H2SYV7_THIRO|nr:hypothetical protein [Thiocapsa roseopersicina]SDW36916.1 hypothetical protein SAMN05421783_103215 [Thiocapsa roseopersicina]